MIERNRLAGEWHVLVNEGEISALKIRRRRKVRPGNDYIVERDDPRRLIHIGSRLHPKHAVDRRIGALSNGYGRARFEVAAIPFFNLGLGNCDFNSVVLKLARPAQLASLVGKKLAC